MNPAQHDFIAALLRAKSDFAEARITRDAFMATMPLRAAASIGLSRDERATIPVEIVGGLPARQSSRNALIESSIAHGL